MEESRKKRLVGAEGRVGYGQEAQHVLDPCLWNPASTNLATTSERLTALMAAPGREAATKSAPGSPLTSASTAEESKTTSLNSSLPAPLFRDLIREHAALGYILTDQGLRFLYCLPNGEHPQFAFLQDEDDFVSRR